MFEQFPYTNFHEINLDWIIQKLKEAYSPDNPPQNVVLSVDGQTGNVQVFPNAVVRLPDVTETTWNIHRLAGEVSRGIQFTPNGAERIEGTNRYDIYDEGNPPPYPVQSVNGQTGVITIQIPVQSVNGQTGIIELYQDALVRWPDVAEGTWNLRRLADGVSRGIQFTPNGAERIEGTNRYLMYDSSNLPKTVDDVDTPIMEIALPSDSTTWGFNRELVDGSATSIYLQKSGDSVKAYISYVSADDQTSVTLPLLSSADIPASAGVVSINGKTGVVTIYGTDIYTEPGGNTTINQELATLTNKDTTQDGLIQQNATANQAEQTRAITAEANIKKTIAIIVDGDTASIAVPAGSYAYIKNNTHGLTEGLYEAQTVFPTTGGTADNTTFTPVTNGGLNALKSSFDSLNSKFTPSEWTRVSSSVSEIMYRKVGNLVEVNVSNYTVSETSNITVIGTLPTGHRPPKSVYQFATSAAGSTAYICVTSNGDVGVYRSTSGAINGHAIFAVEI